MRSDALAVQVERRIFLVRGQKVMLDADLAELYRVPTKSLNLAVKRNADRFPEDFTFQLTDDEVAGLRFHFETSKRGRGGRRYLPYAFTEQGVAMLSSVLRSSRAAQVNTTCGGRRWIDCIGRMVMRPSDWERASQHCHHAHICPFARDASLERGTRPQACGAGKQI
jgi:hypothetical protein